MSVRHVSGLRSRKASILFEDTSTITLVDFGNLSFFDGYWEMGRLFLWVKLRSGGHQRFTIFELLHKPVVRLWLIVRSLK